MQLIAAIINDRKKIAMFRPYLLKYLGSTQLLFLLIIFAEMRKPRHIYFIFILRMLFLNILIRRFARRLLVNLYRYAMSRNLNSFG